MDKTDNDQKLGPLENPHIGQEMVVNLDKLKVYRIPVRTRLVLINEDLIHFIRQSLEGINYSDYQLFAISSKVVSITRGYFRKESDIKVSRLARFLVRFVKKWPDDPGYALPEKIQMAMDMVGLPRFIFAVIGGAIMKYVFRRPGYFYILAGKNIGGIDGFVPSMYPEPLRGYGFFTPPNPWEDANFIEKEIGLPFAILDGNNIEQVLLGYGENFREVASKYFKKEYQRDFKNKKELNAFILKMLKGNPQGQSGNTPILLIKILSVE
ncbi:hypothetical protein D6810_01030 [Candidatus Dojkabacteria bacterium]|uniref:F420-0--gamma-glutamyl ligase n=1 Tax=Candidatus Dojkabacteria bacterium TaxID=2099670 RepID=A0A3M0Z2X9_9BACT|nr:MAG: hypothetical protein D6810_01030 [Candidatus Dojkabacteria bacterium]